MKFLSRLLLGLTLFGSSFAGQQIINQVAPGDNLGDAAYTSFQKVNANFTDLYTVVYAPLTASQPAGMFLGTPSASPGLPAFRALTTVDLPGGFSTVPSSIASLNQQFSAQIYLAASGDTTGATDRANLIAAASTVAASFRLPPSSSSFVPGLMIQLGPGNFYFTQCLAGLLPTTNLKMTGFWLRGSGRGVTWVDYNPSISCPMWTNQKWLEVMMSDMSIVGHDPNSDFLWSQEQAGVSNVQDYTFVDLDIVGTWRTDFRLTGGNNNSEWKFSRVTFTKSDNGIYVPAPIATTISNGSSTILATNVTAQVQVGDTGQFSAAVSPLAANTQYYVVSASGTGFQVALTAGGSPVSFTANGTPNFNTGSDQFLNFWFDKIKWDPGNSLGQWINMASGGSIKIRDSDVSGRSPTSVSYLFNLLGNVHASGVTNFEADGLRIEHSSTNSRTIHSQWGGGSISFNNLDESSQVNRWPATNQYALYEIINLSGPAITYTNSQLMGQHAYINNVNNWNYQNEILYQQDTLLENPNAASFVSVSNVGNTGGYPRMRFKQCKNGSNASTVGYHEICDTDLFWNKTTGGVTDTKVISCLGSNSDWPTIGGNVTFRLPLNAMIQRIRFWNPTGSGAAGAFQYTIQTTDGATILAGGAGTPMAGSNAATPIPAASMYVVSTGNVPFQMTTDAQRTIEVIDTLAGGRSGIMTNVQCLIDYIG